VLFALPPARTRLLILPFAILLCAACVATPPIVATPGACSSLLPAEWRAGVPSAVLPDGSTVGDWIAYADAQTGQLDKANDRYSAAVGIVERCEARDAAAVKQSRRKFLGVFR